VSDNIAANAENKEQDVTSEETPVVDTPVVDIPVVEGAVVETAAGTAPSSNEREARRGSRERVIGEPTASSSSAW
jgi:hypothetical protein